MTYSGLSSYYQAQPYNGMGAYYEFQPHQVFSGVGCCGASGIGAADFPFVADQIWSDWVAGGQCPKVAAACAKARNAADSMRAALQQLGYGALTMGIPWGRSDQAATTKFGADLGLQPTGGMPSLGYVQVMEQMLKANKKPGPAPAIKTTKVGSEFVSGSVGSAGVGGLMMLGLVGAAVVGGVVLLKKYREGAFR